MPSYDPDFFNIDPYYDDFDESKKFLKMLFRPGVALQARELTQIQSILQNQIERFGNFILDDGSMVFGGQITEIPTEVAYIQSLTGGDGIEVTELNDKIITLFNDGQTSHAKVIYGMKSPVDDSDIIYFQYLSGEGITNSASVQGFNEGITFTGSITSDTETGMVVFVDNGIRYTNGYFVLNTAQRLGIYEQDEEVLDFSTPSRSVGFNINKSIVTSQQDTTLRDPASGFYNFNAPGSDRFKIDLTIAQRSLTASSDTAAVDVFSRTDFIEFLRIVDGDVVKRENYADLGEIEETFARRTYDESGHYVVDPFELTMLTGGAGGASKLRSKLDSGKAYVFGYEFETIGSTKLSHDRARGVDHEVGVDDVEYGYSLGPYFLAKFSDIEDGASGVAPNCKVLFDSYSGYVVDVPFGTVDGVRLSVTTEATTKDFVPGLTLYFADNIPDLTGGDGVEYPGASAGIQARILRVIPVGGETAQQFDSQGFAYINAIEIGPPYLTGNNWSGGVTTSFLTTSPFYVAAGPSFEAGFNVTFTGSNVSFFPTVSETQFTGGNINTVVGSARLRNLQKFSGSAYKVFLDDVSINPNYKFSTVKRIFVEGNTGQPAFYAAEIPSELYNLKNTSLVFESPFANVIKTIDAFDYMVDFTIEDLQLTTNPGSWQGQGYELDLDTKISGLVQIGPNISSSSAFYSSDASRIVSVFSEDGKINCEIKISGGTNPKVLTIQNATLASTGSPYTGKVTVVVACQVNQGSRRTKTSNTTTVSLDFTGPDNEGYYYSYFLSGSNYLTDAYSIDSITPALTGYILDTGQKNTYYDWSKIKVSYDPGEESYSADVNHYTHSGYGPFVGGTGTNRSYPNYETIPTFESPDGQTIMLRNSLDFRPIRSLSGESFTLTGPYEYPAYVYDGYEQSVDYTHYLSRIDKIILTKDRTFRIIQGIPNEQPVPPADDPNAMTLYTIRFNPYTFDENDVSILQEDNRRFTMKDIGNLERRIEKLEYYSTLSALELEAKNTPVYDVYGLEIPKKAILVDQFTGTESADVANQDFYCSVDRETKELRPPFDYTEVGYSEFIGDGRLAAGLTNNNGIVTYDFTEEAFISNTKNNNSRFINGNKIVDFVGSVKMVPHCDPWFSTEKKPTIKTNFDGENDSWLIGSPSFQMNSDFTERGWFGKNSNGAKIEKKLTSLTRDKKTTNSPISKISSSTIPQSNISSSVDRIVDTSVVPYCREKTVNLTVKGLKPNKLHYVYFEDELMDPAGVTAAQYGEVSYSLSITGNSYVAGKKLVRVLDNDQNNLSTSTSSADAIFTVSGSTKEPESSRFVRSLMTKREASNSENISNNSLTREFERKEGKSNRSKDNIAQLFTINKDKYNLGIFLRSADIHFNSWPSDSDDFERNLPVKLYLKPVNNGYPSPSKIIAESVVYDIESNNTDGVVNFKFDHPIYLEPGSYALELETNTSNVSVKTYVLPSGKPTSVTTERDSVLDVNIGSFILPKNIGKTEKLNNEFLTFKLYKCEFTTGEGTASIEYTYSSFLANEMRSHIEGSMIDSRYCTIGYGGKTYSSNTNEKIPKGTSTQSEVEIKLSKATADISPAVDIEASNIVFKGYKSGSNIVKETLPKNLESDSIEVDGKFRNVSSSRYITKTVKSLQSATNVSVIFERNQPPGTQIEVYLKRTEPNSLIPFDDAEYVRLQKYSEDPPTLYAEDFVKTEYRYPTTLSEFNTFAVKIVFLKNSSSNDYPSIKNLRVIAI